MTYQETKLNEIHEIVKDLYADMVRVDIGITAYGLEISTQNNHNIKDYSMKRIGGDWVHKAE